MKLKRGKSTFIFSSILILLFVFTIFIPGGASATAILPDVNPILVIEKLNAEQAVAGGEFNVTLGIRNITKNPAFNAELSFKLEGSDDLGPFKLKDPNAVKIKQIDGNASQTVLVTFIVDGTAQNKDYNLIVNLSAQNAEFKDVVRSSTNLTVPVTFDLTKPVLIIQEARVSPENPDLLEGFTVDLLLSNLSKTTDARNILITLDGKDNFEVLDISNMKNLATLGKGSTEKVSYKLRAKETRADNTVDLKLDYDYLGDQHQSTQETINLPLPRQDVAVGATPWVIINKYTLSAEKVLAGNTVTLSLYIENTNHRAVKNVKISLGVIKIEDSSGIGTGGTTGGTVFSPVNSSNSFYLDSIPGKTVITKEIDLYVDPNATAKTYIVPVTISYEDRTGKTLTSEEMVNIPVTQECKLQVLSTQIPPVGFVGQPISVVAEFVNVGKVSLGNFMVSIEGDFETENGSYFVGNLDIGVSDFFQGTIIPQNEGTLEGKLVFSYIDNNNKNIREETPFTVEIQPQPEIVMPGMDGEKFGPERPIGMPKQGGFLSKIKGNLLSIILLLIIVGETVYIVRFKKKKANEEFFNE